MTKLFAVSAALAALTAAPSFAATLSQIDRESILVVAPEANLDGLSPEQVRILSSAAAQTDLPAQPGAAEFVRSVLQG